MQRSGIQPDVVSYALLIKAYGRARREEEALSVFEEMLDAGVRLVSMAEEYAEWFSFGFVINRLLSFFQANT